MKVLLAAPRGFCAGVHMAIQCLEIALRELGSPVYVFHEIVHNRRVVESFEARGTVFINQVEEAPPGGVLVFSAHGVSPAVRQAARRRGLRTIDATCPLVAKVHSEAIRFAREGYTILLIGHAGHDEIQGVIGEAPHAIVLVRSLDDVERLQPPAHAKLAWLTQTTLSVEDTARLIARLQERFPHIEGPAKEDICYATQNRQQALARLCGLADVVVVAGSQNSSNSRRLVDLALSKGTPAHLVDGAKGLHPGWFHSGQTVVVTAGASAPEAAVQEIVAWLVQRYGATVQECDGRIEDQVFALPKEVRRIVASAAQAEAREAFV